MTTNDLQHLAGKFIVFDGPDGCGKTTQMKTLIAKLEHANIQVRQLREPGGTHIGEQIREILLSTQNEGMDIRCEMLLYMASRAQLVHQEIRPALAAGICVVADRFASSTLAYQGAAGLKIEEILEVAKIAVDETWPDLTIIFDLDTDLTISRLNPLTKDRIEQRPRAYFEQVRANYRWQAKQWPDRYRTVNADQEIPQVEKQVMTILQEFFST